jgi:hypothetical protein
LIGKNGGEPNEGRSIMRINATWHARHRMPTHPTLDERIAWHLEHERQCACREIPVALLAEMRHASNATRRLRTMRPRSLRLSRPRSGGPS